MPELQSEIAEFYQSLAGDVDLASPLRWQYSVRNIPTPDVESVISHLTVRGFIEIEPDFNDLDETPDYVDDGTLFRIGFGFVGVHTCESATAQIVELSDWSRERGYEMEDWSAGSP